MKSFLSCRKYLLFKGWKKSICMGLALMLMTVSSPIALAVEPADGQVTSGAITTEGAVSTNGAITTNTAITGTAATLTQPITTNNVTETAIVSATMPAIVPNMEFSKDVINLTLSDAKKKMTTDSPSKTVIDLHKQQDIATSIGHLENVQSYNDAINSGAGVAGSKAMRELERYLRDYAKAQADPNYEAEMNKLSYDTLEKYYQLKQAEQLESIAVENLELKRKLLENTRLKLKAGTVSNMDVLQAESAWNTAKDELFTAQNNLRNAKMGFNTFMGYKLMQSVKLTDSLTQVALPAKPLDQSIKEALQNRNEIKMAEYGLNVGNLTFAIYKSYPQNSAKYLNASLKVAEGEKAVKDTIGLMEMDVRSKYMDMKQKYDAITSGIKVVENAKEGVRLAQLQYDVGMTTLTTINDAQIALNRAQVGLAQNLLNYNLAAAQYEYASGVGMSRAQIN